MLNFQRIELLGFKSFADKVSIDLLDGITAIVGPNGCGKSNVADAIRWVLGEQSAKNLRGSSMQDVIFNGTQSRKSLSYCEVSLYFSNTEKLFPSLEYSEVVFTRKLFRSGESEYYINRQQCRKQDIVDALHECGVSKDGYTIISQGKVSEILSSKPEDRRSIFEEAVGIAKTKKDRRETMNKLQRTEDNITRLCDIINERQNILGPLSKQAEKTRVYRIFADELKTNEVNTYLYKYENASLTKQKITDRINGLSEEISQRKIELEKTELEYNKHLEQINKADDDIRKLNEKITEKAVAIAETSGEAKLYTEKINYFKSEIARLEKENATYEEKIESLKALLVEKNNYKSVCEKEIEALSIEAGSVGKLIAELTQKINDSEDEERSVQSKVIKSVESLADINKNIGSLSTEQSVISTRKQEVIDIVNGLVDKYSILKEQLTKSQLEVQNLDNYITQSKESIKDKEEEIRSSNEYIETLNNKISSLKMKLSSLETSFNLFNGLKDSFDGYNSSVKKLMLMAKENKAVSEKIKGVVASVLSTDKEYETAIQNAIGGAMQNVVVDNPKDAEFLINYLKQNEIHSITFLPITSVKVRNDSIELINALNEEGAIGLATNFVKYDSYYENVVKFLLGGTLLCKDLNSARKIAQKYHFAFKIVTLDGDILAQNGSMTGGAKRKNDTNLLSIDRKVKEFSEAIEKEKKELLRLENNKAELIKVVNVQVEELNALNLSVNDAKQNYIKLKESVLSLESQLTEIETEIEKRKDEIAIINQRLDQIESEYTSIKEGNDVLIKQKESARIEQNAHREEFEELRQERDRVLARNTEIQSNLSHLRAEIASTNSEITRINSDIELYYDSIKNNQSSIAGKNVIIENLTKEAEKVALSSEDRENLENLKAKLNEFDKIKVKLNEELAKDNIKRQALQEDIDKNVAKKTDEEIRLAKVDSDLEYMSESILADYNLTYETCVPLRVEGYDAVKGQEDIISLKRKIAGLGNINPNAIEEFNEHNEKCNELISQKEDLIKAKEDLVNIIEDLTKEMTLTFDDGFKLIKANFSKIFKELFGGGSASLEIIESQTGDPLDAGIEIVAEPPGKKLQKISLLSGGEMSLTAIAILFAILRMRPMPFCVLDEIEAALDDANVDRFARYLKNYSKETQFICITHKKVTMEYADGLFGVTMPEKGVSSIVSVKLSDVKDIED